METDTISNNNNNNNKDNNKSNKDNNKSNKDNEKEYKQLQIIEEDPFSCKFYKLKLKECLDNEHIMPEENKPYCNSIIKMFNPHMCKF